MYLNYQKILIQSSVLCCVVFVAGCAFQSDSKKAQTDSGLKGLVDIYIEDELRPFQTHKRVNDYTSKLAHDLAKNLYNTKLETPVAVASFVSFETGATGSSQFGNLLSESMLGQLQVQNIAVLDIHLFDSNETIIQSGAKFNSNLTEYLETNSIKYVLTGFMIKDTNGITINARISELGSQKVMTSATTLIPYYVADLYN